MGGCERPSLLIYGIRLRDLATWTHELYEDRRLILVKLGWSIL